MLDYLIAFYLIIAVPARQLWTSFKRDKVRSDKTRMQRYIKTIIGIALPLTAVGLSSYWSGRMPASFGLAVPPSLAGKWGLAFSLALLISLALGEPLWEKKLDGEEREKHLAQIKSNEMLPRTHAELWTFCILAFFIAVGWEILYRGFLVLFLLPVTGIAGAVILPALAYGAGHGYQNSRQFIGSIISAFVVTLAFVLSKSLWWLMLLHLGLPLLAAFSSFNILKTASSLPAVEA